MCWHVANNSSNGAFTGKNCDDSAKNTHQWQFIDRESGDVVTELSHNLEVLVCRDDKTYCINFYTEFQWSGDVTQQVLVNENERKKLKPVTVKKHNFLRNGWTFFLGHDTPLSVQNDPSYWAPSHTNYYVSKYASGTKLIVHTGPYLTLIDPKTHLEFKYTRGTCIFNKSKMDKKSLGCSGDRKFHQKQCCRINYWDRWRMDKVKRQDIAANWLKNTVKNRKRKTFTKTRIKIVAVHIKWLVWLKCRDSNKRCVYPKGYDWEHEKNFKHNADAILRSSTDEIWVPDRYQQTQEDEVVNFLDC
jgi:hypothetical protein